MNVTAASILPAGLSRCQRRLTLGAIAVSTFFLGTAELAVVGVLDLIAQDLGADMRAAGLLVTAYALGIALGGPVLSVLFGPLSRRIAMLGFLVIFILSGGVMAGLTTFSMLVASRFLMGAAHGAFVGVASIVAASVSESGSEGRAIAYVVGGVAVSTVVGVPLGAVITQAFGWRAVFLVIMAGTLVSALVLARMLPALANERRGAKGQIRAALGRPLLPIYALASLVFAGEFATLAYLGPYLKAALHASDQEVVRWLFAFGVATAAGTLLGGRMVTTIGVRTLPLYTAVLTLALGTLFYAAGGKVLSLVALLAWGLVAFGIVPALQLRVIQLAGDAPDLAATFTASALNFGIAIGSLVGGEVQAASPVENITLAGTIICALAFVVAWPLRHDALEQGPAHRAGPTA